MSFQFTNFSFKYTSQMEPTLRGINLKAAQGEKILIAGPSGSGKSTLGYFLNGIVPHAYGGETSGAFTLLGKKTDDWSIFDFSVHVGTVLQDTDGQFVALKAAEDIAFAAENDCVPRDEMEKRVVEAARLVDIEDKLDSTPHDLSGGQKQRVSLAGVLLMNTEILLFDEPLANLDPESSAQVIDLIDETHKKTGKTIVIIEHRIEEVLAKPVDRIVVMSEGAIIADGTPADVIASGILARTGLREPLYISAARKAGCPITSEAHPENIDTFVFDKERIVKFCASNEEPVVQKEDAPIALSVENLNFSYDAKTALSNITFSIDEGECAALVGRNGAGKSTLARLICGFLKPSSGKITAAGKDIAGLSIKENALYTGFVMQNPNQMISFPMIYDETAFALRMRGVKEKEIEDSVFYALKICGLYPFRKWPVSALSYGQKKRLTIAAILVTGARFLILDEPTAGQDLRHYTEIMEFLEKLRREERVTLLFITHDMHLMLEYASKAIVLSGGKLLVSAPPARILSDDSIVQSASLKKTSLYTLAARSGITDAEQFIEAFFKGTGDGCA